MGAFINDVTHLGGEGVDIFVTGGEEGVDPSVTSHQSVHRCVHRKTLLFITKPDYKMTLS